MVEPNVTFQVGDYYRVCIECVEDAVERLEAHQMAPGEAQTRAALVEKLNSAEAVEREREKVVVQATLEEEFAQSEEQLFAAHAQAVQNSTRASSAQRRRGARQRKPPPV